MVSGGAGYIGAHIVRRLVLAGQQPVIVDDLSTGITSRVRPHTVHQIDLAADSSVGELTTLMVQHDVDAVVHLAAKKRVEESVLRPHYYYRENIDGLLHITKAMAAAGVRDIVYSSTAAVYGEVNSEYPVPEDAPTSPINPYGRSKLVGEWLLSDLAAQSRLNAISLRYFNVAGCSEPALADMVGENLIPLVLKGLIAGQDPVVFGDDYDTPDGTCIRDYIHVEDLAAAHLDALDSIRRDSMGYRTYNVGTGIGTSVKQIIDEAFAVTGITAGVVHAGRRAGDPANVTADSSRVKAELGWRATKSVQDMVRSTWEALERRAQ